MLLDSMRLICKHCVPALMLASCLLTWTSDVHAAGLSAQQIQEISQVASTALTEDGLPGLAVAVLKDERVWSAGFGKADLEQDVPVTAHSMFRTASIAKWFTATAALRLVEQGKLDLDAPIQQYCVQLPHKQWPHKQWPITSRQLLSHLSGVRHDHGQNGESRATDAERKALEERMHQERISRYTRYTDVIAPLDTFKDDALLFQPGTGAQYSSLGYRVLGCVLQGAAQTQYRKLMHDLVFAPAGMTSIAEDDVLALVPHRVAGYSRGPTNDIVRASFRDVSGNLPAGGYLATAEDLVRFAAAFQSAKLLNTATRERMIERPQLSDGTPAPNPGGTPGYYYGMGVMVDPSAAQPVWFHTGGQSGASALLLLFPKDGIAVALMTNIDGSAIREPLARKIGVIASGT